MRTLMRFLLLIPLLACVTAARPQPVARTNVCIGEYSITARSLEDIANENLNSDMLEWDSVRVRLGIGKPGDALFPRVTDESVCLQAAQALELFLRREHPSRPHLDWTTYRLNVFRIPNGGYAVHRHDASIEHWHPGYILSNSFEVVKVFTF